MVIGSLLVHDTRRPSGSLMGTRWNAGMGLWVWVGCGVNGTTQSRARRALCRFGVQPSGGSAPGRRRCRRAEAGDAGHEIPRSNGTGAWERGRERDPARQGCTLADHDRPEGPARESGEVSGGCRKKRDGGGHRPAAGAGRATPTLDAAGTIFAEQGRWRRRSGPQIRRLAGRSRRRRVRRGRNWGKLGRQRRVRRRSRRRCRNSRRVCRGWSRSCTACC